jgi:hypothetical protein
MVASGEMVTRDFLVASLACMGLLRTLSARLASEVKETVDEGQESKVPSPGVFRRFPTGEPLFPVDF